MSIRLRLAAWCMAIFSVLFVALEVFIYTVHARAEYRDVDDALAAITSHYQSEIERQLADGAPLSGILVAAIDTEGQEVLGADLTVYDAAGEVILGQSLPGAAPSSPADGPAPHGPETFLTLNTATGRVRVHTMPLTAGQRIAGYVQASASLADLDHSINRFRLLLIVAAVSGLVIAIAGSLTTAARALRPVADVTETAHAIALSRGFSRRIEPIHQNDELGELARTFNEMLSSLEEVHQAQRRFVDNAAHELRAPLTSIIGNLDLLERAHDLPEQERTALLADVRAEAERLGRLVNELLTLAQADAGQRLSRAPVDLDRIIVDVVRQARALAEGREVSIVHLSPVVISGDADHLKQLLLILIENAVRYTPAGGHVSVALRASEDEVRISVSDTGIGIAPNDLPHIFDRFYRADPARSRVAGGSGLGLAIAKWIAEAHDGRIEVESEVGQGSTFAVLLPLPSAACASELAAGEDPAPVI
jgi:heavy metal sensor kinase